MQTREQINKKLKKYVFDYYDGNYTRFAEAIKVTRASVSTFLNGSRNVKKILDILEVEPVTMYKKKENKDGYKGKTTKRHS